MIASKCHSVGGSVVAEVRGQGGSRGAPRGTEGHLRGCPRAPEGGAFVCDPRWEPAHTSTRLYKATSYVHTSLKVHLFNIYERVE